MIGSFSSSDDSAMGLDVFKTVVRSFKYLTRTMMSSRFYNTLRMYCLRFSLNFFYWSLASLCSDVVPKNAPKSSTSPLKFLIVDVYTGGWSVHLFHHVLGERLFWYNLLGRVLVTHCFNLIRSSQRHGWLLRHFFPRHWFLRQVRPFLFPESLYFTLFYSSFLNNVKLKILSSFRVGHKPMRL